MRSLDNKLNRILDDRRDRDRVERTAVDRIDSKRLREQSPDIGREAENIVIDFFNEYFGKEIMVRPATPFEDSGTAHNSKSLIPEAGYQIDAVGYGEYGPALCMQVTTTSNEHVFKEKMVQISKEPTVRLEGMRTADVPVPKILIRLDPRSVASFLKDREFDRHKDIAEKIIHDTIISLKYDMIRVHTRKERDRIQKLLDIFEGRQKSSH